VETINCADVVTKKNLIPYGGQTHPGVTRVILSGWLRNRRRR
jgi:hypothetical protein